MLSSVLQPEIRALVKAKDFTKLKAAVSEMIVHDLAELLSELADEDLAVVFRLLPRDSAADIFGDLEFEKQEELLSTLSTEKVASILNDMPPDERTELLEELPGELAQRLLYSLRGDELQIARSLLAYPEDSVGRLMTPEYVAVRADQTIEEVFQHIRKVGASKETLNVIYVVDEGAKLLDEIRLEQFVLAEPSQKVSNLMDKQVAALNAYEDREDAVELFKKYEVVAMPVVNSRGVLVGIVTFDDVFDVAEEEDTEDFQKMAGMGALEYSYFGTGFFAMLRKRLPWLAILLAAQTLTTLALATGFHTLPLFAVLVIFMPLINSPAGNTGSQMAGLMIRGLAVQEVDLGDWLRILTRELARGITIGIFLAVLGYLAAFLFAQMLPTQSHSPRQIALSVGIAMATAVTLANVLGSMLPFLFKRIGLDPAVTSGPFIACLMDISGIMIYFLTATMLFKTIT